MIKRENTGTFPRYVETVEESENEFVVQIFTGKAAVQKYNEALEEEAK